MSALPISMRKIKEVLRLKFDAGLSQHQIAAALKISPGVVNKYLKAANAADITWPLPDDLSEPQLRRKLFPSGASPEPTFAQPDFAAIHQELKRKGVTRQLLWEEYAAANPDNHYKSTQFCLYYQQWRSRLKLSMRQTHFAGEKMFVDYAGPTVPVTNPVTGAIHQAQIFVAVLGASSYTYAEASLSQKVHDWINSHIHAFEFFQGVPQLVVPDNLKSVVTRADRYEPSLNRSYQEMLYLSPEAEHLLDWFHLSMRLTVLNQTAKGLPIKVGEGEEEPELREAVLKLIESSKWYLWHGNVFQALNQLEFVEMDLESVIFQSRDETTRKLRQAVKEFHTYIDRNRAFIPNYGERYRNGERISTGFVESAVNQVVSKRMAKKQQMQWSRRGAHLLLQVRTRVLNGEWEETFRAWYPDFRQQAQSAA